MLSVIYDIEKRSVIFVNYDNSFFTGLFCGSVHETFQALVYVYIFHSSSIGLLIFIQLLVHLFKQKNFRHVLCCGHVEIKDGMLFPFFFQIPGFQIIEQVFSS